MSDDGGFMLNRDLWNGCEAFFDAIAETIAELDSTVLDEAANKGRFDRADILSRHLMQRYPNRTTDPEQARSFERMWIALDWSFQRLASARKEEHPPAP